MQTQNVISENIRQSAEKPYVKSQSTPSGLKLKKLDASENYQPHRDNQLAVVVLRTPVLLLRIALSKATLYNLLNPRSKYFDPVLARCKVQLTKKSVGFIESEVNAWLASRMNVGI